MLRPCGGRSAVRGHEWAARRVDGFWGAPQRIDRRSGGDGGLDLSIDGWRPAMGRPESLVQCFRRSICLRAGVGGEAMQSVAAADLLQLKFLAALRARDVRSVPAPTG